MAPPLLISRTGKLRGAVMSQPELEFEFDPPEFLRDKASSPQAPQKLRILKHVTTVGLLVAATTGIVSLFHGYLNDDMVMSALAKKKSPIAVEETNTALADARVLLAKLE